MKTNSAMKFIVPNGCFVRLEKFSDGSSKLSIKHVEDDEQVDSGIVISLPKDWVSTGEYLPDGRREFTFKPPATTFANITSSQMNDMFKKVLASKLSFDDEFFNHDPKTKREADFKARVRKAITLGVRDFWRPVCDPYFESNDRICYGSGKMPAVGKSYNWWVKHAMEFCPESGSRLGTDMEYVAFMAVLIKDLIASGKPVEWAWNVVCNDPKVLGHYKDSLEAKHRLETTGSREVCGWYDLANTNKILAHEQMHHGYYLAGADYHYYGSQMPLTDVTFRNYSMDKDDNFSCGWLVFDRCPE